MLDVQIDSRANLVVEFLRRRRFGSRRLRQPPVDPQLLAQLVQAADRYRLTPPADACRFDPLLCDCFTPTHELSCTTEHEDEDEAGVQRPTTPPPSRDVERPDQRSPLMLTYLVIETGNYRLVGRLVDLLI